MWIFLKGWWYNLDTATRIRLEDSSLLVYFIGDNNGTSIQNLTKEEEELIKKTLDGRNN